MQVAIYPGSFDPITKGHLDIIHRASKLCDRLIVVILSNPDKHPFFSVEERMESIAIVTEDLGNVEIDCFTGLLADYVKLKGGAVIVRGLRAMSDFEYEFQMSMINKILNPQAETIFMNTSNEYMYLSSSIVKQIGAFGGDISGFVPEKIHDELVKRLKENGVGNGD